MPKPLVRSLCLLVSAQVGGAACFVKTTSEVEPKSAHSPPQASKVGTHADARDCPLGARLRGGVPPKYLLRWCARDDGTKHGRLQSWHLNGQLAESIVYEEGKPVSQAYWNESGERIVRVHVCIVDENDAAILNAGLTVLVKNDGRWTSFQALGVNGLGAALMELSIGDYLLITSCTGDEGRLPVAIRADSPSEMRLFLTEDSRSGHCPGPTVLGTLRCGWK